MPTPSREEWILSALRRYERRLCLYAARLTGDPERARDVVQETFLRLCTERRERVEGHVAEWLFTVCRNRALDLRAKETGMQRILEDGVAERPELDGDPARTLETREERGRVRRFLDALPDAQREVLLLKFQQGLSYREIGRVTGHSVSNVGFLIHRGMRALRERLAGEIRLERAEG